jgi:hypothetical protein
MYLLDYWKPVFGLPAYEVSFRGVIRRVSNFSVKKYHLDKNGYPRVNVKPRSAKRVHRLIALTFIENPENKPEVNHIDGDKLNYSPSNLEWATKIENIRHAIENGLMPQSKRRTPIKVRGLPTPKKPLIKFDLDGKEVYRYPSIIGAATALGVDVKNFRKLILKSPRNYYKGFIYKFA